jgi:hypothetical protein
MHWSLTEFREVKSLIGLGLSDYQIAKSTHIPRGTVQRWRHRDRPPGSAGPLLNALRWGVEEPAVYCYLLGCYLGDGHVTHKPPSTWTLRISCDRRYTAILQEVRTAMELTFPGRRSTRIRASTGAADVISICHPAIGRAFPQHGPGRKHLRE